MDLRIVGKVICCFRQVDLLLIEPHFMLEFFADLIERILVIELRNL